MAGKRGRRARRKKKGKAKKYHYGKAKKPRKGPARKHGKKRKIKIPGKKHAKKIVKKVKSGAKKRKIIAAVKAPLAKKAPHEIQGKGIINIETRPDRLYKLVNSRGKLSILEAANAFGVKEEKIEEWAAILEEHNLIKMHYPAFGKPTLYKIEYKKKKKVSEKGRKVSVKGPKKSKKRALLFGIAVMFTAFLVVYILRPDLLGVAGPNFAGIPAQLNQFSFLPAVLGAALVLVILVAKIRHRKKRGT